MTHFRTSLRSAVHGERRKLPSCGATWAKGDLIGKVLSAALLEGEISYTFGDCPFHGLSADLQLAIALARVSYKAPALIAKNEASLRTLWKKRAPHLLIGHYLLRALKQAKDAGEPIQISAADLASMTGDAALRAPQVKASEEKSGGFYDVGERFHFDSVDTIPYLYEEDLALQPAISRR